MGKKTVEEVEFEEQEFEFDGPEEELVEGEDEVGNNAEDAVEKQRLQRKEQKEQTLKRKLQKPNSDLILEAKSIWEQLRQKRLTKPERKELMDQMMKIVSGKALEVMLRLLDYLQTRCISYRAMLCQIWYSGTTRLDC
jgi:predicted house-cleaning NTP pyrophosphatase (Maf/HAM1 superfamily)